MVCAPFTQTSGGLKPCAALVAPVAASAFSSPPGPVCDHSKNRAACPSPPGAPQGAYLSRGKAARLLFPLLIPVAEGSCVEPRSARRPACLRGTGRVVYLSCRIVARPQSGQESQRRPARYPCDQSHATCVMGFVADHLRNRSSDGMNGMVGVSTRCRRSGVTRAGQDDPRLRRPEPWPEPGPNVREPAGGEQRLEAAGAWTKSLHVSHFDALRDTPRLTAGSVWDEGPEFKSRRPD